ncbi:MAG: hypothetical protein JNK76_02540, partial [Planctomycetales bacterium]|nr:hypothetical protein [Planctomycetales bacterium]
MNAPITLGELRIGDGLGTQLFTFAGSNALTLNNTLGSAVVGKYNGNTDVWQAPLVLSDDVIWKIHAGILDVTGVSNAQVSYSGAGDTIKNGFGTLRLNIDAASYTGDWVLNLGTLTIGGANSATPTSLGTGTGGITLNGSGVSGQAILTLANNGGGSNGLITYGGNNDVILQGQARITVDRNYIGAANSGNTIVLDTLTMNGGVLQSTGANSYNLRFNGTTTLVGETSVFAPNGAGHILTLNGIITDGAATRSLIKEDSGRLRVTSALNTYNGVTAVKDGILQVAAGAVLGTGATFVNGGRLVADNKATLDAISTNGLNLVGQLGTSRFALPVIGINNTYGNIDSLNTVAVNAPISGMMLGIDGTVSNNIDLSQVAGGGNRVWLSNLAGLDTTFSGGLSPAADNNWRVASGANNLIFTGAFTGGIGGSRLIAGFDHSNAIVFTGNALTNASGGTVSVRSDNNAIDAVIVNRGVTLNINGNGLVAPIGGPNAEVVALGGTLSTDNASTAAFGNTFFKMFGGSTLLLDNSAVTTNNINRRLPTGAEVSLDGGTLRIIGDGGAATTSFQELTQIRFSGGSTISVDTDGTTAGRKTVLNPVGFGGGVQPLSREFRGTLNIRSISGNATTFGTALGTQKLILGSNSFSTNYPIATNGMIGAHLVLWGGANSNDGSQPLFVTHDQTDGVPDTDNHGIQAAA